MGNKTDKRLQDRWEERWEGAAINEGLTFIGKGMFRAKRKGIMEVLQKIEVNSVLEVGCGLGYTLQVYHQAGYQAFGIDASEGSIAVCRQKGLPCEVRTLEAQQEHYDLVSSDGMLEHFLHFEPYLARMAELSDGYVLLIQPNHDSFVGKSLAYAAELFELVFGEKNVFEYNYRIKDFIEVAANNGLELVENQPLYFDVIRLLLFKKKGCA